MQSCFSSSFKTFGCALLLGSVLSPFLFNSHLEEETQPIGFSAKNIQLIPHFGLYRCKHCNQMSQHLAETPVQRAENLSGAYRRSNNDPQRKVLQRTSWGITCFFYQKHQSPIHQNGVKLPGSFPSVIKH